MAIENGYATLAEFKAYYTNITSTDATDDGAIEAIIEGVSRWIDRKTGRTFYARTETRYYGVPKDPSRTLVLDDDLLIITTLTNGDDDTIAATEYNLWPKNDPPYRRIKLKASSTEYWEMDSDGNVEDVISVAGTWGFIAATPDEVREACLELAASRYSRRVGENVSSVATVTAAGVVLTPQNVEAKVLADLAHYKRLI